MIYKWGGGGVKTIVSNQLLRNSAIKSVQDLSPTSLLIEVNPNASRSAIESAKRSLKAINSILQFSTAYTYHDERVYPTNQIIISLKPNSSIVQVHTTIHGFCL